MPMVQCLDCWRDGGAKCIVCASTPARNERIYLHRCKECVAEGKDQAIQTLLVREAEEWLQREGSRPEQDWNGTEPALQLLLFP